MAYPEEILKNAAQDYFIGMLSSLGKAIIQISFEKKVQGTSPGLVMKIAYNDATGSHSICYYIKLNQSQPDNPLDLRELYVYKVLENTGDGPKTHFIIIPRGLFIATQDCAFSKDPTKQKTFDCFSSIEDEFDDDLERKDPRYEEARKALLRFDMLSKIFYLLDTVVNANNFGYVTVNSVREKWKLIDFSLFTEYGPSKKLFDTNITDRFSPKTENPILHKDKLAKEIMLELHAGKISQTRGTSKLPLLAAMENAFLEIVKYCVENRPALALQDFASAINALRDYHFKALDNYQRLAIYLGVPIPAKE